MADSPFADVAHVVGAVAVRPIADVASLGRRLERRARTTALGRTSGAALAVLDTLLASRFAAEAVDRVLASSLARRAVSGALEGPAVEAATREVIRHSVLERVAAELVASDALERVTGTVVAGGAVDALVERVLVDGVVEQAAARVLEGPELERVVAATLDSPAMERLVVRLLESDELWLVVDEVAHSPAVTEAIAQQSASFADQVAGGVRTRSRDADAWVEAKVRRALRRRPAAASDAAAGLDGAHPPGPR